MRNLLVQVPMSEGGKGVGAFHEIREGDGEDRF